MSSWGLSADPWPGGGVGRGGSRVGDRWGWLSIGICGGFTGGSPRCRSVGADLRTGALTY